MFQTIAHALAPWIPNSTSLLDATAAVMNVFPAYPPAPDGVALPYLVSTALGDSETMRYMRMGKKILAIKALRDMTNVSLKEAKKALEDYRVVNATGYTAPY